MTRGRALATIAAVLVALAVAVAALRGRAHRRSSLPTPSSEGRGRPTGEAARARLQEIPFYRAMLGGRGLRSVSIDPDGTLRVEVDLRAVVEPRLAVVGLTDASGLLPVSARGTIVAERSPGTSSSVSLHESWIFDGPAAVFDLLDRSPAGASSTLALDAIPGTPSAVVRMRLKPSSLTDPSWGGAAFATWRDRASFAEKLLGRPLRAEIAEDLAGPAVFALYETSDPAAAEAIVAIELRRSDRLAGLFDMVFGLGALAERATVRRYRGVATGSFVSDSGASSLAFAVDGPVLFVATSRASLEAAMDARRAGLHRGWASSTDGDPEASWNAMSTSTFVAHGWARLARLSDDPKTPGVTTAALWPEGASSWRLEGHGPAPAITADPMLPFLRSALARRQGEGD